MSESLLTSQWAIDINPDRLTSVGSSLVLGEARQASTTDNIVDLACTVGAWIVNASAMIASFEVSEFAASLSAYDDNFSTRAVVLWSVTAVAGAAATSILVAVFRWAIKGNLRGAEVEGAHESVKEGFQG